MHSTRNQRVASRNGGYEELSNHMRSEKYECAFDCARSLKAKGTHLFKQRLFCLKRRAMVDKIYGMVKSLSYKKDQERLSYPEDKIDHADGTQISPILIPQGRRPTLKQGRFGSSKTQWTEINAEDVCSTGWSLQVTVQNCITGGLHLLRDIDVR